MVFNYELKLPSILDFDVFGDRFLSDPRLVFYRHSRTQSHDHISSILADLATHGVQTALKSVPFAESQSQRLADLVTCRGGLFRSILQLNFDRSTLLVMNFDLGHTYTSLHRINQQKIANIEHHK